MARGGLYIGEVARRAGVNPRTIRYYEGLGLLDPPPRSEGRYRLYPPEAVERLGFIKKAQALGLTLEEIREIIGLRRQGVVPCVHVRDLLERKIALLDRKVADLRTLRRRLNVLLEEWGARSESQSVRPPSRDAGVTKSGGAPIPAVVQPLSGGGRSLERGRDRCPRRVSHASWASRGTGSCTGRPTRGRRR